MQNVVLAAAVSAASGRSGTSGHRALDVVLLHGAPLAPAKKKKKKKKKNKPPPCKKGKEHAGCKVHGTYKFVAGRQYVNITLATAGGIGVTVGDRVNCGNSPTDAAQGFYLPGKHAVIGKSYSMHGSIPDDGSGTSTDGTVKVTFTSAKVAKVVSHVNVSGVNASESTPVGPCSPSDVSVSAKRGTT